jgi:hypothetical protein
VGATWRRGPGIGAWLTTAHLGIPWSDVRLRAVEAIARLSLTTPAAGE